MAKHKTKKKDDQFMSIAIVVLAMVILGFFFLIIASMQGLAGKLSLNLPGRVSSFALITAWAAVLVPVLVKSKKAKTYDEKKSVVTMLAVIGLFVVLTVLFLTNPNLG